MVDATEWLILAWDPYTEEFIALDAQLGSIDFNWFEQPKATFTMPFTEANWDLATDGYAIVFFYGGQYVWDGFLAIATIDNGKIMCTVVNYAFKLLEEHTITGTFEDSDTATVLEAICDAAGLTYITCPEYGISVRFDEVDCFAAAKYVLEAVRAQDSNYILMGSYDPETGEGSVLIASNRDSILLAEPTLRGFGMDGTMYRDFVKIRGVDDAGLRITGSYGDEESSSRLVLTEKKVTTQEQLDLLAEAKYDELNTWTPGFTALIPINQAHEDELFDMEVRPNWQVIILKYDYDLWGEWFTIYGMRISATQVMFQLDKRDANMERLMHDLRKQSDLGIYKLDPYQNTPIAVSPNQLWSLYHCYEGTPGGVCDVIKDSSPIPEEAHDGEATNGNWNESAAGLVYLSFDADGYVDCGDSYDLSALEVMSVGLWFSPEALPLGSNEMELIYQSSHFRVCIYSSEGLIRFMLRDSGGSWHTVTTERAVGAWGRYFVMCTYDGEYMRIYINGELAEEDTSMSGGIYDTTPDTVYLAATGAGSFFDGAIGEVMLWKRCLSSQEVKELYFFPLNRLVRRAAGEAEPPEPVLPPVYSGVLVMFTNGGGFASPQLSEEAWCTNMETVEETFTEDAECTSNETIQESLDEDVEVSNTPRVSESISEVPTVQAADPLITYVGATTATGNNSTSGSFTLPGGWAAGDVALFFWYTRAYNKTFTLPAGVTQLQDAAASPHGHIYVGYRVLQSGDSTFAWTSSSVSSSDVVWGASVFRGVDNASPIDAESGAPTEFDNAIDPELPSITVVNDLSAIVCVFGKTNDYTSVSPPSGGFAMCGSGSSTAGSDASSGRAYAYRFAGEWGPGVFDLGGGASTDDGYTYCVSLKPA